MPRDDPGPKRLKTTICQQVNALCEDQRRVFLSMYNMHSYASASEQYLGIVLTNALPIETGKIGGGIFLGACRVNHACDNNAQKNWNENIKRYTVQALRDINEGEEITIYYLSTDMNSKARKEALLAKFGFICSCSLCSLPPKDSRESDERFTQIQQLEGLIGQSGLFGILSSPSKVLHFVDQQVQLYLQQGPGDAGLARAFMDAAQIAIANGDLARGRIFVERALDSWRASLGGDSKEVTEHEVLAKVPSKHHLYGYSMAWKTKMGEVPSGLGVGEFEDWLWKRERPQRPGSLADLRNRATFPGFDRLPSQNVIDLDFYGGGDTRTCRPRRHWCFLAEIVDFYTLVRLKLEVKDVDGKTIPLFFYTDGRGEELPPSQIQIGYTAAILYANYHSFAFDSPGIRLEDARMIKIFPTSLHSLLAISDLVQQFSTEVDGLRICHGCGKKAASLRRCAKCLLFWYCSTSCQTAGWNDKCHKTDCKLLRDPSLRGLFALNWDEFDSSIEFPLLAQETPTSRPTAPRDEVDRDEAPGQRILLRKSENTVAADEATSSHTPIAPESISLAKDGAPEHEEALNERCADLRLQETPESSSRNEEARETTTLTSKGLPEPALKSCTVKLVDGRGKGLVATAKIVRGTRLLSEAPIFRVPRNTSDIGALELTVAREVEALDSDQRRAFFDLHNIYGNRHSESFGIARTNVLPLGSGSTSGGLFLEASRINHSCRHNAQNTWNENIERLTIHALRDIEVGQEITISYLASTSEYAERQRSLRNAFKFDCKCERCSLPRAERKRSDARLRKLEALDHAVGRYSWGDLEAKIALNLVHDMLLLFDEEGIWDARIARAYKDAYNIAMEDEDEARAGIFAERTYDARRLIEGDDSPTTAAMKQAAEALSMSRPQGMNNVDLERWLWMLA